jgi:predicted ArsR family transcriptional regulator
MVGINWIETLLGGTRARVLGLIRRSRRTIAELAEGVGISGNAVRGHVTALQGDGLVREAGTAPSTGGKPAQLYDITPEGEELFPKAYALVLHELVRTLQEEDGRERTLGLLRSVGRRAAQQAAPPPGRPGSSDGVEGRVVAAADVLRSIGGEVTVSAVDGGWEIRGSGCPLNAVVVQEPDVCALAQALVADIIGGEVEECCDRGGGRACCRFRIAADRVRPAVVR